MSYLMESEQETSRLWAQQTAEDARQRFVATGLRPGQTALDVGCGPGFLTEVMADLVAPDGRVTGLDRNPKRVALAQQRTEHRRNLGFIRGDVYALPLATEAFDYVFSQFLFQYLPDPKRALAELCRVTAAGGRIVVSEIDGAGLYNWPFPEHLERGVSRVLKAARRAGFDDQIGRKLYSLFLRTGLQAVNVRVYPHYLFAGAADQRTLEDWRVRFQTLAPLMIPEFGDQKSYDTFCCDYLGLLQDPGALKYSVLLITEGVRP